MDHHTFSDESTAPIDTVAPNTYTPEYEPYDDVPVYTESEADTTLKTESDRLERLRAELEQKQADFLAKTVDHPDVIAAKGERKAEILKQKIADHTPSLVETEHKVELLTDDIHQTAGAIADQTRESMVEFTPAEYQVLAARDSIIAGDCERLSLTKLVAEVRYALVTEDRVALFSYTKHLPARLASSEDTSREREPLRRMLATAERKLRSDRLAPIHDRAKTLRAEAVKVSIRAGKRRMREAAKRAVFVGPNDVEW